MNKATKKSFGSNKKKKGKTKMLEKFGIPITIILIMLVGVLLVG
jgi:hypothetical protein